jgi:hypothetical protein
MTPAEKTLVAETAKRLKARKANLTDMHGIVLHRNDARARTLRQYQKLLASPGGPAAADYWIAFMEQETLARRANHDAALRDIAADYIVRGEIVPPVLRRYTRKVLHGTFAVKGKKRGRPGDRNYARDIEIAMQVALLRDAGTFPTKNEATDDRESGCAIVAAALSALGTPIKESGVLKIWKKYGSRIRRQQR